MSLHSLLTVLLLIPARPIACTRSSTRAGRDATDPSLLDHRDQRLLRRLPGLQEGREVAALPQLGDAELQGAEPRIQRSVAVAVRMMSFVKPCLLSCIGRLGLACIRSGA